jgi:hypothetical protein
MLDFSENIIRQSRAGYESVVKNKRKDEKGSKKQKRSFFTDVDYK